jgi:serine/threonine-protein kinase
MVGGEANHEGLAATQPATTERRRYSLARRAFLPSPLEERPGPVRIDAFARLRAMVEISAVLFDLVVYAAFRGSPFFDRRALDLFVAINVPLLLVAAALCWFPLRTKGRWHGPLSIVCLSIEAFTCVTWIQLTGTVSSYFLVAIPLLILGYRLYARYRLGLLVYAVGAVMHLVAFGLEQFGVLRPAALFVTDPGAIYSVPLFRFAALVSIQMLFLSVFIIANIVARALLEKETALDAAQRDLDRAVAEAKPGRLSGLVLAGKYQLGELLGRGGMGEVYQATRLADSHTVAIKILYGHLAGDDNLERFRREAAIAMKLPATLVAQVFEIGHATEGGHHYIAMELLEGEDLGMLLRRRRLLPAAELLPILDQLVMAVEAAHAAGIVHRDLKPQNVFLSSTAGALAVKLLDFGVARFTEGNNLTQSAMLIGSPGYLAPEQVAEEFGEIGPRADVFALGTIAYRALTGHNAFPARNAAAAVYEAVHHEPPPPSTVEASLSPDVDCVVAIALAKRPEQRYASARELAQDLRSACDSALGDTCRARARALGARRSVPALEPTLAASP